MTAVASSIRSVARGLPLAERKARQERAVAATDASLLRAVVHAGCSGCEWASVSDCAERALVVAPRTLRRWLADDATVLPSVVRDKLERLAWAFGVDVEQRAA